MLNKSVKEETNFPKKTKKTTTFFILITEPDPDRKPNP
jgi:hypothetical protein